MLIRCFYPFQKGKTWAERVGCKDRPVVVDSLACILILSHAKVCGKDTDGSLDLGRIRDDRPFGS